MLILTTAKLFWHYLSLVRDTVVLLESVAGELS